MTEKIVKLSIIIGLILLGITSFYSGLSYSNGLVWVPSCTGHGGSWMQRQFYEGESIPDGWYWIQASYFSNNETVSFPLCPSCGSRLHGTWNTIIYVPDDFRGYVRLSNNIIMELRT